ncbi:MAG: ptsN 1 [Verrucomicrobiales bacterium]|nr:ptsN 1 [Verrucomicrobiales bacterium]
MKTKPLFCSPQILTELRGRTAFEVIDELMAHLACLRKVPQSAKEPIATAVKNREKTMSTGIGFGIALPHAYSNLIGEAIVMLGRSNEGIDFCALDHQPVRIAVLVIAPAHDRQEHLWILSSVARLFHQKQIRHAVENAADAETIATILNNRSFTSSGLIPYP